jgi:flagellin-specific chaperone FliS
MENNLEQLETIVSEFENTLKWKRGGSIEERVSHCLNQYRQIADNAINEAKGFLEDSKTQYKALEIITEGLTSEGLNHTHKRIIANHIITMLRSMVDRLDQAKYEYNTNVLERYNFFRSNTPERKLYEDRANLSLRVQQQDAFINDLKGKHPDIFKDSDLPF